MKTVQMACFAQEAVFCGNIPTAEWSHLPILNLNSSHSISNLQKKISQDNIPNRAKGGGVGAILLLSSYMTRVVIT